MPESTFYKQVFETITDGTIILSDQGQIILFNTAAADILGISPELALGKSFAEVFLMCREENDEFCQVVMDSIYNPGKVQQKSVPYLQNDDTQVFLDIKASFLADQQNRDSKSVIIVFSDITELRRVLDEEKALTRRLAEAYQELEGKAEEQQTKIHKRKLIRRLALVLVLLLLLGAGFFTIRMQRGFGTLLSMEKEKPEAFTGSAIKVEPQPLSQYITLSGSIQPLEEMVITSPFNGVVLEKYVFYGMEVPQNAPLLRLDDQELMVKIRDAETTLIKAQQEYDKLKTWKDSDEVASARRTLVKAKNSLESQRRKLDVNHKLFEQGIIPEEEYDSVRESYESQKLDYNSAMESLDSAREKGDEKHLNISRLTLENARYKFEALKDKQGKCIIKAPVKGVVIRPKANNSPKRQNLEVGARFDEGSLLLAVGNLEGLSIKSKIDELDVLKVRIGQKATVIGEAFKGTELSGEVSQISSQAVADTTGGAAMFEITVSITDLTDETMENIRLGMIVKMRIKVYDNHAALLIPIIGVHAEPNGGYFVLCRRQGQESAGFDKCPITNGRTTSEAVEVLQGLSAGDSILIPD